MIFKTTWFCVHSPGYTYQYSQMNAPINTYSPHFQILAFPCDQFGLQEPGRNPEILNGIKYVRPGGGFEPQFPVFGKTHVNGQNELPLFTFLKVCIVFVLMVIIQMKIQVVIF